MNEEEPLNDDPLLDAIWTCVTNHTVSIVKRIYREIPTCDKCTSYNNRCTDCSIAIAFLVGQEFGKVINRE